MARGPICSTQLLFATELILASQTRDCHPAFSLPREIRDQRGAKYRHCYHQEPSDGHRTIRELVFPWLIAVIPVNFRRNLRGLLLL